MNNEKSIKEILEKFLNFHKNEGFKNIYNNVSFFFLIILDCKQIKQRIQKSL
jgi:hypothetical protein